jgi:hypothetical protein
MRVYVVCMYSAIDGMRVRGVRESLSEAQELAWNLWKRAPVDKPTDFVVQAWATDGEFEVNPFGENAHVIYTIGREIRRRNQHLEWTPPKL